MSEGRRQEREVAQRALCLGVLVQRWQWEQQAQLMDVSQSLAPAYASQALLAWANDEGLSAAFSPQEAALLRAPFATWSLSDLASVLDLAERLAVLLWSLHVLDDLLAYDTPSPLHLLLPPLELLTPSIDFVWCARLRPQADLEALRDEAALWQWRAQAEDLERMGLRTAEGQPMRAVIRQELAQAQARGHLRGLLDGDFHAFGRPYAHLSEPQHALIRAISIQRAHASAWLCDAEMGWEG